MSQSLDADRDFYRLLPDGRSISAVAFGCSSIWAQPGFARRNAYELLDLARDGGINYLDTAPSYGNGEAERRLGEWLKDSGSDMIVSTKVGTNLGSDGRIFRSFKASDMEASLSASLGRLKQERVDLLYLHGPSTEDINDEVLRYLEREKERGRILWAGVNSFDASVLAACVRAPIDATMLQFNVADRSVEFLLPRLAAHGKIIISATAMARAIYSWSTFFPRSRSHLWYLLRALKSDPLFIAKGVRLGRRMRRVGDDSAAVALKYVVGQRYIHTSLFGTSSADHMRANISAARNPLSIHELELLS